ncbi:MAG: hypothetical protein LBD10_14130 [Desulfobulbus sp.]|jgi:hypothetical protein|uniref:hypothetical protein n=1 Tax=Desulfobulbus sp. TaxID=895 RepID=UPI00283C2E54|nr:hypothetical protein [Desulfobulbus sp.]MDR2551329.1 hypothetical protein [Desulfobulbus sp.]
MPRTEPCTTFFGLVDLDVVYLVFQAFFTFAFIVIGLALFAFLLFVSFRLLCKLFLKIDDRLSQTPASPSLPATHDSLPAQAPPSEAVHDR